mgnify:CR=1 FL=1
MATTVFLIRHAAHGLVGNVLCGRMPAVHLDDSGRCQAALLARHLACEKLAAIYSSPLPRARETAAPIAERSGLDVRTCDALNEIDFGGWTGRSFASLEDDPHWRRWNAERDAERPPAGESMQEAQHRAVRCVERMAEAHPEAAIAAVSHADVIKAVVAAVLGLPLGAHARFEIAPASLTTLLLWPGGARLLRMNEVVAA